MAITVKNCTQRSKFLSNCSYLFTLFHIFSPKLSLQENFLIIPCPSLLQTLIFWHFLCFKNLPQTCNTLIKQPIWERFQISVLCKQCFACLVQVEIDIRELPTWVNSDFSDRTYFFWAENRTTLWILNHCLRQSFKIFKTLFETFNQWLSWICHQSLTYLTLKNIWQKSSQISMVYKCTENKFVINCGIKFQL